MSIQGYADYKKRAFCNDVKCPVQLELNSKRQSSDEYEKVRQICKTDCKFTAWQFHHWLIDKGYLVVKPEE